MRIAGRTKTEKLVVLPVGNTKPVVTMHRDLSKFVSLAGRYLGFACLGDEFTQLTLISPEVTAHE